MFSTPISEIREVKEYCEENIEAGSIHFHALMSTLREGSARHTDFLGLSSPNSLGYTLLPVDTSKNTTEVEAIIAKAPTSTPIRTDYSTDLEFMRARLRYRVASIQSREAKAITEEGATEPAPPKRVFNPIPDDIIIKQAENNIKGTSEGGHSLYGDFIQHKGKKL